MLPKLNNLVKTLESLNSFWDHLNKQKAKLSKYLELLAACWNNRVIEMHCCFRTVQALNYNDGIFCFFNVCFLICRCWEFGTLTCKYANRDYLECFPRAQSMVRYFSAHYNWKDICFWHKFRYHRILKVTIVVTFDFSSAWMTFLWSSRYLGGKWLLLSRGHYFRGRVVVTLGGGVVVFTLKGFFSNSISYFTTVSITMCYDEEHSKLFTAFNHQVSSHYFPSLFVKHDFVTAWCKTTQNN